MISLYGNTISWTTRKQTTVALSSTEAEYVSLSQSSCEAIWLKNLLSQFGIVKDIPLIIYEDNQSCICIAEEPRDQKRMKHLDIRYNFIRECIENGIISVKYIPTSEQVADVLTKSLSAGTFKRHRLALGVQESAEEIFREATIERGC
uniref:Reverse transcriptase Ty1/copia-type domain-containing protein n=1 Tax=Anopheles atroparvus TaxID=41427 RepID=A0AAG5CQQ5_ANOAO